MEACLGLGTVGKDSAAEQTVAVRRGPISEGREQMLAAVIDEQTGQSGPAHEVLTTGQYGAQVTLMGMASSLDGRRTVWARGNSGTEDPQAIVLGGDAERRGNPIAVKSDHHWDCLGVIPTTAAAAVSVVETRDGSRFWHLVELDAEGAQVFESSVDVTEDLSGSSTGCPFSVALTKGGFAALMRGSNAALIVVDVDRATFADDGATRVSLDVDAEPVSHPLAFASMNGGYVGYFTGGAEGSKPIRFFDASGQGLIGGIDLPAGISIGGPIDSTPGSLLLSFREGDGPWGWLEATCGDE
jgi:hypothetical protein